MYTEQPQLFAAVRSSHFASAAFAATDIRFDGASIPRAESSRILGHFHYFARKFVTQHTWVCVYGGAFRQEHGNRFHKPQLDERG